MDSFSIEELKAQLEKAKQENENLQKELKKKNTREITIKVSDKGCLQINGLRRFPFTFYKNEITKILSMSTEIQTFINQNEKNLR